MASKGQTFKNYSKDLKLEVVRQRLNGVSLPKLSKHYQITDSMIINWVKKYQEYGEEGLVSQRGKKGISNILKGKSKEKFSSVEEENDYLRLENEYLKKRMSEERGVSIDSLNLWSSKHHR